MNRPRKQAARLLAASIAELPPLVPVREAIDWGCINRIAAFAAQRRAELGEERWAELTRELDT
jgi:hypothetical protein